jgi:hypothetical protein
MFRSGVKFFVRIVATGFALSLGSALFKKIQDRIGLGEEKAGGGDEADEGDAEAKAKGKKRKGKGADEAPGDAELERGDAATDPTL